MHYVPHLPNPIRKKGHLTSNSNSKIQPMNQEMRQIRGLGFNTQLSYFANQSSAYWTCPILSFKNPATVKDVR